jgi:DNA/RNA-binding domain of Phe-tRNA-synthetase-like protein
VSVEPAPQAAVVAPELEEDLPGLAVWSLPAERAGRRTPAGVRERLLLLDARWRGPDALLLRRRPTTHAYRVLFFHLGLDPDVQPTPAERAVRDRLVHGTFATGDRLRDALTLAVVETGVPVLALDAEAAGEELALRAARPGDELVVPGGARVPLVPGRIVLADARRPLAVLFGTLSADCEPTPRTRSLRLAAVQAPSVPAAHVSEALWLASEALAA